LKRLWNMLSYRSSFPREWTNIRSLIQATLNFESLNIWTEDLELVKQYWDQDLLAQILFIVNRKRGIAEFWERPLVRACLETNIRSRRRILYITEQVARKTIKHVKQRWMCTKTESWLLTKKSWRFDEVWMKSSENRRDAQETIYRCFRSRIS